MTGAPARPNPFTLPMNPSLTRYIVLGVCALAVAVAPRPVEAFSVVGRVVNGTTGAPLAPATIKVVNPSSGMLTENEVETTDDQGHFRAEGLDASKPVYLFRVKYKGVSYTEMVRYHDHDPITIELKVYEPTSSWEDVTVSIPHFVVLRSGDTLSVHKFYQITNSTHPPRTVTGTDAQFEFSLPPDMLRLRSASVSSLGMPIPIDPTPIDDAGRYTIDYPMRPGVTQVSVSIDLPYGTGAYAYREKLPYDIDELTLLTRDSSLQVTHAGAALERADDVQGFVAYRLTGLGAGTELSLDFAGGRAAPAVRPTVFIVPSASNRMSIIVLFGLGVLLLGTLGYYVMRRDTGDDGRGFLMDRRDRLLDQLARLEDLYATGTVSEKIYGIKRTELMNVLAGIYYQIRTAKAGIAQRSGTTSTDRRGDRRFGRGQRGRSGGRRPSGGRPQRERDGRRDGRAPREGDGGDERRRKRGGRRGGRGSGGQGGGREGGGRREGGREGGGREGDGAGGGNGDRGGGGRGRRPSRRRRRPSKGEASA